MNSAFVKDNFYVYDTYKHSITGVKMFRVQTVYKGYEHTFVESKFKEYFYDISDYKPGKVAEKKNMGPKRDSVKSIVDRSFEDLLKEGMGFLEIKENLKLRSLKIKSNMIRDMKLCADLKDKDPDVILNNEEFWPMIESSRIKYNIFYINHCNKRIDDINWIIKNRLKFSEYDSLQVFNLIKLKEKLSLENAEPVDQIITEKNGYYFDCNKRMK
jgi:hypothetical protein